MADDQSPREPVASDQAQSRRDPNAPAMMDASQTRRRFLRWLIRASYGAFALAFALPALALRTLTRESDAVAAGDLLVYASDERQGVPVSAEELQPGTAVQAFPQDKTTDSNNLIQLVRLAENSSDVVAYSAICTHLGCTVQPTLDDEGLIFCLCHGSYFNPAEDASVVGGPAGRPLASLPIQVNDDGTIVATSGFAGDVGPE